MVNHATAQSLELFTPEVIASETPAGTIAVEFVRWCCSHGDNFRNSPDATNLQFWLRKTEIQLAKSDEGIVLAESRHLLMKRIEQHVRKSATPLAES